MTDITYFIAWNCVPICLFLGILTLIFLVAAFIYDHLNKTNLALIIALIATGLSFLLFLTPPVQQGMACADLNYLAGKAAKNKSTNQIFSYQKSEPVKEIVPHASKPLVLKNGHQRKMWDGQIGHYDESTYNASLANKKKAYFITLKIKPKYKHLINHIFLADPNYYEHRIVIWRYHYQKPEKFD